MHHNVAYRILLGYVGYYYHFKLITKSAKGHFENRDWHGTQNDARSRINLYRDDVGETAHAIGELVKELEIDTAFWHRVKATFTEEIGHFDTRNIAETFYNSVYRHFHQIGADPELMFVARTGSYREYEGQNKITYDYPLAGRDLREVVNEVLDRFPFDAEWDDRERDVNLVAERWKAWAGTQVPGDMASATGQLQVLRSIFYRNKSAYIVGRLLLGADIYPFILPLLHPENRGILIDALLLESDQVTSIFSYHRSYFLADISVPSEMVDFLQTTMPTKRISELYNAIGFEKHGKTVFYRELSRHLDNGTEEFVTAPGISGMVMYVFTMPELNMVFKLIRDVFAPPKQVSQETVKEKYELVKAHDRVGRMADSYLFQKFSLPLDRFDADCLEELKMAAPSKVSVEDACVNISHIYVEKKMTPLNLFLETATPELARKALRDYGRAIKQLAAANIFPGDLLLKNFGVTRVNRVVFYDYDEIELVTDCNFRHIPEPRTPEQEMASSPWYYVGPRDIFPEEFPGFLMRAGDNLTYLREIHGEIFDANFWNDVKARLLAGEIMDVFPYRTGQRFLQ